MYFTPLCLLIFLVTSDAATTIEDVNDSITESFDKYMRPSAMNEKTVSELVNEQTETIKKIISSHNPDTETPILPDKEPAILNGNGYEKPVKENGQSFEDFKAKCEYYFKMYLDRPKESEKYEESSKQSSLLESQYINSKKESDNTKSGLYLYASSYGNQAVPFPVYAPNQFNSKPTTDYTALNVDEAKANQIMQNKYYNYVPYGFYPYPVQHITTQNGNLANGVVQYTTAYQPVQNENFAASSLQHTAHQKIQNGNFGNGGVQYIATHQQETQKENLATNPVHTTTATHQQIYDKQNNNFAAGNIKYQTTQSFGQHETNLGQNYHYQNQEIKYIKVAPLTLQNALVSDGKTLYYWYKSMPGYQIYVPAAYSENNSPKLEEPLSESSEINNYESNIRYTYITHPPKIASTTIRPPVSITPPTTATTTTTELVPSYEVKYTTKDFPKDVLKHQLKFVYPVPYPNSDTITKTPGQIDPYAYYPRELQPSWVNVPVPYRPTFHMIRTIDIPNRYVDNNAVNKVKLTNKK